MTFLRKHVFNPFAAADFSRIIEICLTLVEMFIY